MKKLLFVMSLLGVFFMLAAATCAKEEIKDFTCQCTYVPNDTSLATKVETSVVKAEDNFDADMECNNLECKYCTQYFAGTCTVQ